MILALQISALYFASLGSSDVPFPEEETRLKDDYFFITVRLDSVIKLSLVTEVRHPA